MRGAFLDRFHAIAGGGADVRDFSARVASTRGELFPKKRRRVGGEAHLHQCGCQSDPAKTSLRLEFLGASKGFLPLRRIAAADQQHAEQRLESGRPRRMPNPSPHRLYAQIRRLVLHTHHREVDEEPLILGILFDRLP